MAAANAGVHEFTLWCMAFLHWSFLRGCLSLEQRQECSIRVRVALEIERSLPSSSMTAA